MAHPNGFVGGFPVEADHVESAPVAFETPDVGIVATTADDNVWLSLYDRRDRSRVIVTITAQDAEELVVALSAVLDLGGDEPED